jgi:hypothetical protein
MRERRDFNFVTSLASRPFQALNLHRKLHTLALLPLLPQRAALNVATNLATVGPVPPVIYTLMKKNLLGTHFKVKDGEGKDVAEWDDTYLESAYGTHNFKVP